MRFRKPAVALVAAASRGMASKKALVNSGGRPLASTCARIPSKATNSYLLALGDNGNLPNSQNSKCSARRQRIPRIPPRQGAAHSATPHVNRFQCLDLCLNLLCHLQLHPSCRWAGCRSSVPRVSKTTAPTHTWSSHGLGSRVRPFTSESEVHY